MKYCPKWCWLINAESVNFRSYRSKVEAGGPWDSIHHVSETGFNFWQESGSQELAEAGVLMSVMSVSFQPVLQRRPIWRDHFRIEPSLTGIFKLPLPKLMHDFPHLVHRPWFLFVLKSSPPLIQMEKEHPLPTGNQSWQCNIPIDSKPCLVNSGGPSK